MVRDKFIPVPVKDQTANYYAGLLAVHPELKVIDQLFFYKASSDDIHLHEPLEVLKKKLSEKSTEDVVNIQGRILSQDPHLVSRELVELLEGFPGQLIIHSEFQHPAECTREAFDTCAKLANAGIILSNRMGLIQGLNDVPETVRELNHRLLMMRVRPYTIRNILWSQPELQVSVEAGIAILETLRGWTSGLAVPHYVVQEANGTKKVLVPNYIKSHQNETYVFRNYRYDEFPYREE